MKVTSYHIQNILQAHKRLMGDAGHGDDNILLKSPKEHDRLTISQKTRELLESGRQSSILVSAKSAGSDQYHGIDTKKMTSIQKIKFRVVLDDKIDELREISLHVNETGVE